MLSFNIVPIPGTIVLVLSTSCKSASAYKPSYPGRFGTGKYVHHEVEQLLSLAVGDIIVTAAPDHVPGPLIAQLKDGGRLVIPVGAVGAYQTLWQIVKQGDELISNNMGAVVFVPLTGEH